MGLCGGGADQLGDGRVEGRVADCKVDARRWAGSALQLAREGEWVLRIEVKLFERD